MKGKGKKQTCEKKNQTWAQRNQNRKTGNCQTRRHQHDGLASSVEEITNLANNIVPLGGQTVVLVEKTTISSNATSPLRETGRMV